MMDFKGRSVLVTGGAGFFGGHLVEELVKEEALVTVIDDLRTGDLANLDSVGKELTFKRLDLQQLEFAGYLSVNNFDVIYHFAGNAYVPPSVKDPSYDYENNLHTTFKLLEGMRKTKSKATLIFASSAAVYGNPAAVPITENDLTIPIAPYGVSKLAAERYVAVYSQLYGIKAVSLRIFSLYGPRQRKQVVYDFIQKLYQNSEEMVILGNGKQTRDLVFVKDAVQATMKVTNGPLNGEVYNVGTGIEYSTLELAKIIAGIMGVAPKYEFTGNVRPGDPDRWVANINKIRELGYQPSYSLKEGLERTVEWFL